MIFYIFGEQFTFLNIQTITRTEIFTKPTATIYCMERMTDVIQLNSLQKLDFTRWPPWGLTYGWIFIITNAKCKLRI